MIREQMQTAFFIVVLAALALAFARVVSSLVVPLIVAVILALLLRHRRHPHGWLIDHARMGRGVATLITVVALFLLLSVPGAFFGTLIVREIDEGVRLILEMIG